MSTICHVCDGEAIPISEVREYTVGRRSAVVRDEFMRCRACAEEFYLPGQMDAVQRRASAAIRDEEGLLLPEEIRAMREGLGLSQAEFERLLGVGPKTVVRWEKGTVFQNKATDALLRLLNADRENVRRLSQWHQVPLSTPAIRDRERTGSGGGYVKYESPPIHGRAIGDQADHARFWAGAQPMLVAVSTDALLITGESDDR
jgi:HTH-type transcriptional regulator / antitoxin MqsA